MTFWRNNYFKIFFIFANTIHFAWIFVKLILSRVFKLEVPSYLGSLSIYQRWIAENLAVIRPIEVCECVNENFQCSQEVAYQKSKRFVCLFCVQGIHRHLSKWLDFKNCKKNFINQCILMDMHLCEHGHVHVSACTWTCIYKFIYLQVCM